MGFFRDLKDNLNETANDFDKKNVERNTGSMMINTLDASESLAQPELARLAASLAKEAELSFDKEYSNKFHSNDNRKSGRTNDAMIDQSPTDNIFVDTITDGDMSTDNMFFSDITASNTSADGTLADGTSADNVFANNITAGDTNGASADNVFANNITAGDILADGTSADNVFVNNITADDTNSTLADGTSADNVFANNITADDTFADNVFANNITTGDTFADETSADGVSADNVSINNTFANNTSAEKKPKTESEFTKQSALFDSDKNLENNPAMSQENVSIIAKEMTIKGELDSQESIELYGLVVGNITCAKKLTISGTLIGDVNTNEMFAEDARIQGNVKGTGTVKIGHKTIVVGNISATSAVIAGAVKGDIDVHGPVIIDSTAVVLGDIKSESVQVNSGATIQGCCLLCYADFKPTDIFEDFIEQVNQNK